METQTCFKCEQKKDKTAFPMLDGLDILSMICCECRRKQEEKE